MHEGQNVEIVSKQPELRRCLSHDGLSARRYVGMIHMQWDAVVQLYKGTLMNVEQRLVKNPLSQAERILFVPFTLGLNAALRVYKCDSCRAQQLLVPKPITQYLSLAIQNNQIDDALAAPQSRTPGSPTGTAGGGSTLGRYISMLSEVSKPASIKFPVCTAFRGSKPLCLVGKMRTAEHYWPSSPLLGNGHNKLDEHLCSCRLRGLEARALG
ncbi:hypothetical protein B0H11DRAFT_1933953 [Mycena galericulata]|nr:hypothetical protein B0H11DRAFT_1933953 [Mycena galericulata]